MKKFFVKFFSFLFSRPSIVKYKLIGGLLSWQKNKTVHHVVMTDVKQQIIQQLASEYEIKTAKDIQDNLKALKIPIHIVLLKSSNFVGVIS